MKLSRNLSPLAATLAIGLTASTVGIAAPTSADTSAAMAMLRHAIGVHTVQGQHQVPALAGYLADRLQAGGFAADDIQIIPVGETAALVARYRGAGHGKPIYLSGHMDVVAAKAADWTRDPFTLIEENGYLYGRGTADMKTAVVALVQTLIVLKREGFKPGCDIYLLLSGDEETDMASTRELVRRYHDARYLLNADAGGGTLDATTGRPVVYQIQAAEKTYADFRITYTSPGGHSSEPAPDNAIYRLARALEKVAAYAFPVASNDITRASLRAAGAHTPGALGAAMTRFANTPDDAAAAATISADPAYVGQIRTTCVATMLDGGHALNALPQSASANINCRIFPGTSVSSVRDTLVRIIADPTARISVLDPPPVESPASPLRADVIATVTAAVHARFPEVEIVPGMSSGASDSLYFRNAGVPSYGIDAAFTKPDDSFAHGLNEKLPATEMAADLTFWHDVLRQLAR